MANYDLSRLRVLMVERSQIMRTMMRSVLHELNIRSIVEASSPGEGFQAFLNNAVDLILVDWGPDFDGLGLLNRVRRDRQSPNPFVPAIVVTANTEKRHVYLARDAGATDFLAKPLSAKLLYDRICAVVENERAFIKCAKYIGPDRRRRDGAYGGEDRRAPRPPRPSGAGPRPSVRAA
jgi:DNA-binding response OmpR family regulator